MEENGTKANNATNTGIIINEGRVAMLKKRLGSLPLHLISIRSQNGEQKQSDTVHAAVEATSSIKSLLQVAFDRYWEFKGDKGTTEDLHRLLSTSGSANTRHLLQYLIENHDSEENKGNVNLLFPHLKNQLTKADPKNPNRIRPSEVALELITSPQSSDVERLWLETLSPVVKLNTDITIAIKCIYSEYWNTKGDGLIGKKTPYTINKCRELVYSLYEYQEECSIYTNSYKENYRFRGTDSQAKKLMCELYSLVNKKTDSKYEPLKKLLYNTFPDKPVSVEQCAKLVEEKLHASESEKSSFRLGNVGK